jgi:hypothetical protein
LAWAFRPTQKNHISYGKICLLIPALIASEREESDTSGRKRHAQDQKKELSFHNSHKSGTIFPLLDGRHDFFWKNPEQDA